MVYTIFKRINLLQPQKTKKQLYAFISEMKNVIVCLARINTLISRYLFSLRELCKTLRRVLCPDYYFSGFEARLREIRFLNFHCHHF